MPPCEVESVTRAAEPGIRSWSPDRSRYVVSRKDSNGIYQVYVGVAGGGEAKCITCTRRRGGPPVNKHKIHVGWHPSGKWINMAVERENYAVPWLATPELMEGWIQCGLWIDHWLVTPDGQKWYRMSRYGPEQGSLVNGAIGPIFTRDGKRVVWSQIVDGNIFAYTFGRWELILADVKVSKAGVPSFVNKRNITPKDMHWNEPGNFHPDGRTLLLTGHIGTTDASGQDQYTLDIETLQLVNLTNSGIAWDEHGVFSPNGKKIFFMSSAPFLHEPWVHNSLFLKTEFMLMDADGSNVQRLTHFFEPGYPESNMPFKGGIAAAGEWAHDGRSVVALSLSFPVYDTWEIRFKEVCG